MAVAAATMGNRNGLLMRACARNVPAELHVEHPQDGTITMRARLLGSENEFLYVDRPGAPGEEPPLHPRQPILVFFLLNGTRYAFQSRVLRVHCLFKLNDQQRIPATALRLPTELRVQQRRADFRLSLAAYDDLGIVVHEASTEHPSSAPLPAKRLQGRLLNVSAGGLAVLVSTQKARAWRSGERVYLSFTLPEAPDEFFMLAEVRHARRLHEGVSTIVGFKFLPWQLVSSHRYSRQITRFIAEAQRRRLRRH